MFRSYLPFILAMIGLPLIFYNFIDPLFEWQIAVVNTDLPSSYEIHISASPWQTQLGDSLNDKSYVFRKVYVSKNGKACAKRDLNFVVKRSRSDELLEQLSLLPQLNHDSFHWVLWWILIEITLSLGYLWWFTIWHRHQSVFIPIFATMFFCFVMMPAMRMLGPTIGSIDGSANCEGTVMFSAKLLKVNYSVPILLLTGMLAEAAAVAIMVRQIIVSVRKGREASKPAVG